MPGKDLPPLDTSCDAFLAGRIKVKQPLSGFRSGHDAVFLAASCPARPGESVLEAGCGAGVASLCIAARVPDVQITGVEVDPALAELARANATLNGIEDRFKVITADVTAAASELDAKGIRRETYDHVIANPPFFPAEGARVSSDERRALSRVMEKGGLEGWMRFLAASAKPGGSCAIVHTAEALPELLAAMRGRFGALRILPLYPRRGADAIRVIIRGKKGSRAPLSLAQGLVLHEDDGAPSEAAVAILRDAKELV